MNRKNMVWVKTGKRTPAKLTDWDKSEITKMVEVEIEKTTKLKAIVSRIEVKAGRVYLFHLFEPSLPEGAILTVPLIDDKYIECVLGRITICNKSLQICTLDWQSSNNKWMTIGEGSLEECIQIAEKSDWFEV